MEEEIIKLRKENEAIRGAIETVFSGWKEKVGRDENGYVEYTKDWLQLEIKRRIN